MPCPATEWWNDMSEEELHEREQAWFRKNTLPVLVAIATLILSIMGATITFAIKFGGDQERTSSLLAFQSKQITQLADQQTSTSSSLERLAQDIARTNVANANAAGITATTLSSLSAAIQDMRTEAAADRSRRDNQIDRLEAQLQTLQQLSVPIPKGNR